MTDSKLYKVYLVVKNKATMNTSTSSRPLIVEDQPITNNNE